MKTGGRHLSPETQQERRRQVVQAIVEQGRSQVEAVRVFDAGRTSIPRWWIAYRRRGLVALRAHKRGPKPHSRLAGH